MATRQDLVGSKIYDAFLRTPEVQTGLTLTPQVIAAGAAAATVDATAGPAVFCDPGGGAINLLLPAETAGLMFIIVNTADAAEAITVKDDAGAITVITLAQNEAGLVVCDGTTWYGFVGAET